jgi:hydroxymethylglutaryl-CoA reductase
MVRAGGGFTAEVPEALMIGQIQLTGITSSERAVAALEREKPELIALAARAVPGLIARGGGPREIEVRDLGHGVIVLHVLVDCRDAMGANLVNGIAEAVGPVAQRATGGVLGLRILSNLCDRRRVRATCRVHARDLVLTRSISQTSLGAIEVDRALPSGAEELEPHEIVDGIVGASRFAELDPYRAATHNKGIMNGVDAVVIATGNDFRAVEAGAHAYAARTGQYRPLAVWRRDGEDLVGELEMPLSLGTVGGTLRVHPVARLALAILGTSDANELAMTAASLGLASNLAALRALATEGIQRGHMSLHARSVAVAAGALGDEVELVAATIAARGSILYAEAVAVLAELRASSAAPDPVDS